jgi:hypothetical protein
MAGSQPTEKRSLAADLRDLVASPRELWMAYAMLFIECIGLYSMLYTLVLWLSVDFGYRFPDRRRPCSVGLLAHAVTPSRSPSSYRSPRR